MKTLFLFSTASGYGGAEKSLEAVFPELTRAFRVVAFAEHTAHLRALEKAGAAGRDARIITLPGGMTPGVVTRNIATVAREWRHSPPHVLLSNTNKGALWAAACQRLAKRPLPAFLFVRDFGWQLRPLIFNLLRDWSAIVPSPAVPASDYWQPRLTAAKLHVIPNAAPTPAPARGMGTADQAAAGNYVLCLANQSRWKGIDYLIRAFSDAKVPGLRLIIQGKASDGVYRTELGLLVSTLGLADRVEFREFGNDVDALYTNSRCVAVPSISDHGGPESFGRTVIEAWAHGRPVVAFSCGGPKYLIRDGTDGFLVPEKDTTGFARKIRRLALDARLCHEMGEAGRQRATTEFSVEAVAAALVHTLNGRADGAVTLSRVGGDSA